MVDVVFRQGVALPTGKNYNVKVPGKLFISSVEVEKGIKFGFSEDVSVLKLSRELIEKEKLEINWEVAFRDETQVVKIDGLSLVFRSNVHGHLFFGKKEFTKTFDLLGLAKNEFELSNVATLTISAFPYISKKSPDLKAEIEFFAPIIKLSEDRKRCIIGNQIGEFNIHEANAIGNKPIVEDPDYDEVEPNLQLINENANKFGLDPDLIKAIIYMETTHGYYDRVTPWKKTIRPMNVHFEYWKDLGIDEKKMKNPSLNIQAGCRLLSRIQNRIKDPTIRKVASIYNFLGAEKVTEYGARVEKIYEEKLWLKS